VLILRPTNPSASSSAPDDPYHMAICGLGTQSGRAPQEGARGLYAPTRRHKQVHEVDRGLADHEDQV
jgi:hypothetical protein